MILDQPITKNGLKNGVKSTLIHTSRTGKINTMPYRRSRRSSRRRVPSNPITHVPSAMGNSPAANIAIVFVAGVCTRLAGASLTGTTTEEDRDRAIAVGRQVGTMVARITVEKATAGGILEYGWVKVEKADTTPALGTLLPTSVECDTQGTQQALRQEQPGQVIYYDQLAFSPETTRSKQAVARWGKYRMSKCRVGDHFIFYVFQRGGNNSTTYNVQFLYKTSG